MTADWKRMIPRHDFALVRHVELVPDNESIIIDPFADDIFSNGRDVFDIGASMVVKVLRVGPGLRDRQTGIVEPVMVKSGDYCIIEKKVCYRPHWSNGAPGGKFGVYLVRASNLLAAFELDGTVAFREADDDGE